MTERGGDASPARPRVDASGVGHPARSGAPALDVLIPTCDRPAALAVTLTSLLAQDWAPMRIVVSDQGSEPAMEVSGVLRAAVRALRAHGSSVEILRHVPRRGMAEQRQFLLDQARAPYALAIDDDVILGPNLVPRLLRTIRQQGCGFVGSALIGLGYVGDERPDEEAVEWWDGPVRPEVVRPGSGEWERHRLHNAANVWHVQRRLGLTPETQRLYRVAWVGGCVLWDVAALREAGGFSFWEQLPPAHAGEDVLAQLRVMARRGGCAVMPSEAYHQELETTVTDRRVDAPWALPDALPDATGAAR